MAEKRLSEMNAEELYNCSLNFHIELAKRYAEAKGFQNPQITVTRKKEEVAS